MGKARPCSLQRPWIGHFRQLHIQGIAEPFWKGRIFRILEILGVQEQKNLQASTITNGTVFSRRIRDQWREMCPRSLTLVSIDAASPQVYKAIRRIDGLERVVENLKAFCREKGPQQICAIANNINTFNVGEVEQMVEMAANAGCDYISLNATDEVDRSMAHFTVNSSNWQRFAEAEERARAAAERLGIPLYFVKPLHKNLARQGANTE